MHGRGFCCDCNQVFSPQVQGSPRSSRFQFPARVFLGKASASLQLLFPLEFAPPGPDRSPPSLGSSVPTHSTLAISAWDQEGLLHPGFSELTPFGSPPGAKLASLFRREAEKAHPTHRPQREHPRLHPGASPSRFQSLWPLGAGCMGKGAVEGFAHQHCPGMGRPHCLSATCALAPNPGELLRPPFPTIVFISDYKIMCHQYELSFSKKYWLK